jgi:hypothetical protein
LKIEETAVATNEDQVLKEIGNRRSPSGRYRKKNEAGYMKFFNMEKACRLQNKKNEEEKK